MVVGIHLAARGHIAQRIHGFDAHARILIAYQRGKQRLSHHFLRAGAVERLDRLQPHRGVAVCASRAA